MKQKKGKDYKSSRQWTDEDRQGKKRLIKSISTSILKDELDEDKLVSSMQEDKKEESEIQDKVGKQNEE